MSKICVMKEKWGNGVVEKRRVKMANSKWVNDDRKLKGGSASGIFGSICKKVFLEKRSS